MSDLSIRMSLYFSDSKIRGQNALGTPCFWSSFSRTASFSSMIFLPNFPARPGADNDAGVPNALQEMAAQKTDFRNLFFEFFHGA